ncbi:unnamed protein product [Discosporangium mesarthrocarpum]
MVRCLMAVLFLVGRGLEKPDIFSFLMDISRCPGKPFYEMAPENGLLLHDCNFRSLNFLHTTENLFRLQGHLEKLWEEAAIKSARLLNNLEYLANKTVKEKDVWAFANERLTRIEQNKERRNLLSNAQVKKRGLTLTRPADTTPSAALLPQQHPQAHWVGVGGSGQDLEGLVRTEGVDPEVEVTWREVLARFRRVGMGPEHDLGRKGHTPLEQRNRGPCYDDLAKGLKGKRR